MSDLLYSLFDFRCNLHGKSWNWIEAGLLKRNGLRSAQTGRPLGVHSSSRIGYALRRLEKQYDAGYKRTKDVDWPYPDCPDAIGLEKEAVLNEVLGKTDPLIDSRNLQFTVPYLKQYVV